MSSDKDATIIAELTQSISDYHAQIQSLILRYRNKIEQLESELPGGTATLPGGYWRVVAFCDSLVKVRIFIERNLTYIESLGILALTRYIFELSVWVCLLEKDERYGLVYYKQLLENNKWFYLDLKNNLLREIELFKRIETRENAQIRSVVKSSDSKLQPEEVTSKIHAIEAEIDAEIALSFCLYGLDAKTNGYGFQAHLIESQAVTQAQAALVQIESEKKQFDEIWGASVKEVAAGKWNWKKQAELVGMLDDYDFIYSYTSRLLHAEPISLTTDQKSLENKEICLFLRYILIRLGELTQKANRLINIGTLH
jgi:hypothetical protein